MEVHGVPFPVPWMEHQHGGGMSSWDVWALLALGAFHGLNPAMGWLFAAALALQARSRRVLAWALVPIAAGHALSMASTMLVVEELRLVASDTAIRIGGAGALVAFAGWQILRNHRHPRWVGMRLRAWELGLWSFLMSTAHGAGLMLIPIAMRFPGSSHDGMPMPSTLAPLAGSVLVHTAAMAAVAGVIAFAVYEFLGVGFLRRGWINLDRVWPYALGAGAAATLLIA
jgi:hypothetical protein